MKKLIKQKKFGIIGAGRLGLCFGLLAESKGYTVHASDINKKYINNLERKKIETFEPNVSKLLFNSKKIFFHSNNKDLIQNCDIIYTFVPTPSKKNGSYDLKFLDKVVKDLADFQRNNSKKAKTLIVGCTTNPGDCFKLATLLKPLNVDVYYNPEFIAQGSIIADLKKADMVLIGRNDQNKSKNININFIKEIYKNIQKNTPKFYDMSYSSAEVVKLSINCFLTTKISYANFIGQILNNMGKEKEINIALSAIGDDTRIGSKYLKFGYGFGGPCLPRDNRSLGSISKKMGIKNNLGIVVDDFNNDHIHYLKKFLIKKNIKNLPFYFDTLAYKKGTDILTESHQLKVFLEICKLGKTIYLKEKKIIVSNVKQLLNDRYFKNVIFINKKKDLPKDYFKVSI